MTTVTAQRTTVGRDPIARDEGTFALLPGTLAYIDSFAGLIPCRVVHVEDKGDVSVVTTAPRPGYPAGERHRFTNNDTLTRVIPRTAVYRRNGILRIAGFPVIAYKR